jgi:hypothetical protein
MNCAAHDPAKLVLCTDKELENIVSWLHDLKQRANDESEKTWEKRKKIHLPYANIVIRNPLHMPLLREPETGFTYITGRITIGVERLFGDRAIYTIQGEGIDKRIDPHSLEFRFSGAYGDWFTINDTIYGSFSRKIDRSRQGTIDIRPKNVLESGANILLPTYE